MAFTRITCSPHVPDSRSPCPRIDCTCSGHWSISVTSCPALVSMPPTTLPIAPAPMIPILMMEPPVRDASTRLGRSLHCYAPGMLRLAHLTWPEARRGARDRRTIVLVPLGALEQHGPHLPLSVDWIGSEELARRVAPHLARRGWRPVLAPSLPYGASPLAATWPGTVSLTE